MIPIKDNYSPSLKTATLFLKHSGKSAILLGFITKTKRKLVGQEQPRDSGTASEIDIIPPSPPGSAIMSCEEGCLPSHLQHPPAQASRDPK